MSLTAINAVLEHSPTTGTVRLLELVLASHVNEERLIERGEARAWPSQRRLAKLCNCSRRSIQERLDGLVGMGCITDTGERRGRRVVVWELLVPEWTDIPTSRTKEGSGRTYQPVMDGFAQRLDGHTSTEQEEGTRKEKKEKKNPRDVGPVGDTSLQGLDSSKSNGKPTRFESEQELRSLIAKNEAVPTVGTERAIQELRAQLNSATA